MDTFANMQASRKRQQNYTATYPRKKTDKYFQTEAHLSISPLNCCPFACVTKPEQKCRDKRRREKEEQKHLALEMDNTFCTRAHTTGEEVQREVCAQNESLLAHLKGEHSIKRCHRAWQNWSGLALKLILYFNNVQRTRSSWRSC